MVLKSEAEFLLNPKKSTSRSWATKAKVKKITRKSAPTQTSEDSGISKPWNLQMEKCAKKIDRKNTQKNFLVKKERDFQQHKVLKSQNCTTYWIKKPVFCKNFTKIFFLICSKIANDFQNFFSCLS